MEMDGCSGSECQGTCDFHSGGTCIREYADSCNHNCSSAFAAMTRGF